MGRKVTPIITHTEIIARAAKSIEREIEELRERCNVLPKEQADVYFDMSAKELVEKLDALKTMYRFETGTDFD